MAVRPEASPNTTHIHAQEIVDFAQAIRLQNPHQFDLLVGTQTPVPLGSKTEPTRRHAVAVCAGLCGHTGRIVGRVVAAAHQARERGVRDGRFIPEAVGGVDTAEGVWGDKGRGWRVPV